MAQAWPPLYAAAAPPGFAVPRHVPGRPLAQTFPRTAADALGTTDSVTRGRSSARSAADSLGTTDSVIGVRPARTAADILGTTDAAAPQAAAPTSGLAFRLKAQGQSFVNNDPVGTAVSSVGPNMSQATSGKRPTFKTGIQNGKSAFRLDGSDDRLVSAANLDLSATDDITYVIIGGPISSQGEVALLHHNTGSVAQSGFAFWPNIAGGVIEMLNNGNGGQNWQNITGAGVGVKAYVVSIDRAAAAAGEITARVNGAAASLSQQASGNNTDNFANAALYIGARPGDDLFCNADVLEVLIYNHKLDSTELAALDAYVTSEYAL